MARTDLDDLMFWDGVAEVYDTCGLPRDLIKLRLRQKGMDFRGAEFDRLLDYLVARRNGRGEKLEWEALRDLLIPLPEYRELSDAALDLCGVCGQPMGGKPFLHHLKGHVTH